MDSLKIFSICKDVADFNGLGFDSNSEGITISNGFFDDETDEDEVNFTTKILSKAKKEIESSGIFCERLKRKDDLMFFNVEYKNN